MKGKNPQIEEAQFIPRMIKVKKATSRYILAKLQNNQDKETISKAREKT